MLDWEKLSELCETCRRCPLYQTCTKPVLGEGAEDAEILIVGEAPGKQEDLQGRMFVGPAGQLLDKMLACIGLDRSTVYLANVVKCRPPQNRDPSQTEQEACLPLLRAQFLLVRPKIIVCLGRIAAQAIIRPDFKITREHGQWTERKGCLMTATWHPSALLRDPGKKPAAYADLLAIQKKLEELKNSGK